MDYNIKFVKGFIELAKDGYLHNWHERNGGNLSYRLTEKDVEEASKYFKENNEYKPIGVSVPKLANEYFMVTGSGKFFKNVDLDTEDSTCIIQLDNSGDNYRVLWGLKNGGRPTSELPTHLMNHEIKKITTDNKYRVISSLVPGVMGTTGIETKEIIEGVIEKTKPDFLIVIDALAASSLERINKTIQITDTGIHPGSGLLNNRFEISKETLGIPVIAIGIPTVVDATTIVSNTINYIFRHFSYEKENINNSKLKLVPPSSRDYKSHDKTLERHEREEVMGLIGNLSED